MIVGVVDGPVHLMGIEGDSFGGKAVKVIIAIGDGASGGFGDMEAIARGAHLIAVMRQWGGRIVLVVLLDVDFAQTVHLVVLVVRGDSVGVGDGLKVSHRVVGVGSGAKSLAAANCPRRFQVYSVQTSLL